MKNNREIPTNIDAEKGLLCCIALSNSALNKAMDAVPVDAFSVIGNKTIYSAIKNLYENSKVVNLTNLLFELNKNDDINKIGGKEYLLDVLNVEPTSGRIDDFIEQVLDCYHRRNLIDTASKIFNDAYNGSIDTNELFDDAENSIMNVSKSRSSNSIRTFKEVLNSTMEKLDKLSKNNGEVTGLPTGFNDWDRETSGLHEGQLIIIGARPAMGKTVFALNVATHVALKTDKRVAVFNLEMEAETLTNRILSSVSTVNGRKFNNGRFDTNDWVKINEAASTLEKAKLYIADNSSANIGDIRSTCRKLASSEEGLGLIIIDYLQLVSGGKAYGSNRQQEVSDISRALKLLALELKIPIIALCQLSRSVETREDKRPTLSDLRESGSIEQDADIVGFLYRDSYYKKTENPGAPTEAELIIGKHRNGNTGTIKLIFRGDTCSFLNYAKEEG